MVALLSMDGKQEKANGKETPTDLMLLSSKVRWKELAAGDSDSAFVVWKEANWMKMIELAGLVGLGEVRTGFWGRRED